MSRPPNRTAGAPTSATPTAHTHAESDVTSLTIDLANRSGSPVTVTGFVTGAAMGPAFGGPGADVIMSSGQMWACRYVMPPGSGHITDMAVRVAVVGSAGALIRLSLWTSASAAPGILIYDAGTVSGTSVASGVNIGAGFASQALAAGTEFWACAQCQGSPATAPTIRTLSSQDPGLVGAMSAIAASAVLNSYIAAGPAGAYTAAQAFPASAGSLVAPKLAVKVTT